MRWIFAPKLSMFDAIAMGLVLGSIQFIGWWALLAAFGLILASSIAEVVMLKEKPR